MLDSDKLAAYAALAGPALTAAGGRIIARGMPTTLYEQGQMQRTVLIEFDGVEAANAAYKSAGYAEALAALDGVLCVRSASLRQLTNLSSSC